MDKIICIPPEGEGCILFYLCPSVQDIFRRIFLSNYWWQISDIWSQASYRYAILWEAFLYPRSPKGEGGILFYLCPSVQDNFLSNCWWQKSDIWSQASYRYPISWEAFLNPSDSYFLFVDFVDFYTHLTYITFVYAHFSSHFSKQLLMTGIWYLVTSFI